MARAQAPAGLTRQVREQALALGAHAVGMAPVARFESPDYDPRKVFVYPPTGYGPGELLPGARSVIVLALAQLTGVMESAATPARTTFPLGFFGYVQLNRKLNNICYDLALWLEERGWSTLPLGPGMGSRYNQQATAGNAPLYGVFSLKRAAVLAGVGRRARNGLVAHPQYGTKMRLAALVTAAPLAGDPLLEGSPCPPTCTICMDTCPTRAISPDGRVDHFRCYTDVGRLGTARAEVEGRIRERYPVDEPGAPYIHNDMAAVELHGHRLCKMACTVLCPLGDRTSPQLLRRVRDWARENPPMDMSGWEPPPAQES